jgi:hypothetical protein
VAVSFRCEGLQRYNLWRAYRRRVDGHYGAMDPSARFVLGQTLRTAQVETDSVMIEATRHDRNRQRLSQMVTIAEHSIRMVPIHLGYAWPSELDLMAQLAGMNLRERWSGWSRQPFTAASGQHVSAYELLRTHAWTRSTREAWPRCLVPPSQP